MEAYGLAEVIKSNANGYKEGDIISSRIKWADYSILSADAVFNKIDTSENLPLPYYLSVLGMTSLTAFFGLTEAGQLKKYLSDKHEKGPVVCVSAASGAVGSTVVQIAKHLLGASKVIGISGSNEKQGGLKSLVLTCASIIRIQTTRIRLSNSLMVIISMFTLITSEVTYLALS